MAPAALTLIKLALADLRAPAYPVTGGGGPDPATMYPLDMSVVTRGFQLDGSGVVVIGAPGGGEYHNPASVSLYALGQHASFQRAADRDASQAAFLVQSHYLRRSQDAAGGWRYPVPVPRYAAVAGWYSAMAQGLAASVLLRAAELTGEESYRDAADAAVHLLLTPVEVGGCSQYDSLGKPFLEECPSEPPSHILNGAIFALIGLAEYEVRRGGHFSAAAAGRLAESLPSFDLGYWSRYDLRFAVPATLAYHSLHISLLTVAGQFFPGHGFEQMAAWWEVLRRRPDCQLRAAARKIGFVLREYHSQSPETPGRRIRKSRLSEQRPQQEESRRQQPHG
jgi:heparosan-N-sulfate-glucuronate 5-epimerase